MDCGLGRGLVTLLVYQLVNLLVTFWFTSWFLAPLIGLVLAGVLAVCWASSTGAILAHLHAERLSLLAGIRSKLVSPSKRRWNPNRALSPIESKGHPLKKESPVDVGVDACGQGVELVQIEPEVPCP